MPSKTPRLPIRLKPHIRARFKKLRELTGTPESRWVAMLLEDTAPMLDALIASIEAAKTNPQKAADLMRDAYHDAVRQAAHEQADLELEIARRSRR